MLCQLTKFQYHTFYPSQDIKQNFLIKTIHDVVNFKIYLQSISKTLAHREKKRKAETPKCKYLCERAL